MSSVAPSSPVEPSAATSADTADAQLATARSEDEAVRQDHSFLGHPRGLATLFGLELWERFSYLGFQAILALYFADAVSNGGLGYAQNVASSVVAAYGALVYLLSIAGAWIADRVAGTYRTVLWGGIIIAAGHILMGIPWEFATWAGLALIVIGTGLLKPNVSTKVGELYEKGDARRDAGFSIYYSGINIGALLGPLVAGWLGQEISWHAGFAAAAVGMILGVLQYVCGRRHLAGREDMIRVRRAFRADGAFWATVGLALAAVAAAAVFTLLARDGLASLVNVISLVSAIVPIAMLAWMALSRRVTAAERRNLAPYSLLLIALVAYNLVYFQTGSTLNFLALQRTQNRLLGMDYPSTWYISLTAIVEIAMGPVLAWLWIRMGRRQPHVGAKVAIGTILGGVAFLIVALGASLTPAAGMLSALWLVGCYVALGLGDLILQTSGMSATTKLAPRAFASQTMALWFASMALAQGIQAQIVKLFADDSAALYFGVQGAVVAGYGILLLVLTPWLSRRMHSVA